MNSELFSEKKKMELDDYSPIVQLSRFLYLGKEFGIYRPENISTHNYFFPVNVSCIQELAKDDTNKLMPIKMITKAFESNLVPHPETLIFALAMCCKQDFSKDLSHAAYGAIEKICLTPEHFILFIKFVSQLSKQKIMSIHCNEPSRGWSNSLRKAINNWYLSKKPLELANCVTQCKSRYGWKHKDIIKLSHPCPNTPAQALILKYVMHGLEETKKSFGNNPDVQELIEYFQRVEDFKHCEDKIKAADLLEKYEFTLDYVPGHMLKCKEVWNSLIPLMDLHTLLNNIQRIHNLGLLKPDEPAIEKIINEITNKERLSHDYIHPVFVYITLKNYENSGRLLLYEKQKIKKQAKKPFPPLPKPNTKIIHALYQAFDLSIMNLKPTGLRYMITISVNKVMWETCTWRTGNMNGAEAGFLIAYIFSCCEKNVTIAAFDAANLNIINSNQLSDFPFIMTLRHLMTNNTIRLESPIVWAYQNHHQYDVFINVIDQIVEDCEFEHELEKYKVLMNLPHTKLINCIVCSSKRYEKDVHYGKNILTIYGLDATVPMIIQAFSQSLF